MDPQRWKAARWCPARWGRVLVMRARGDADWALGKDRVLAVQGFRPDHDRLAARGFTVAVEPEGLGASQPRWSRS
jgi:hypothetical protein